MSEENTLAGRIIDNLKAALAEAQRKLAEAEAQLAEDRGLEYFALKEELEQTKSKLTAAQAAAAAMRGALEQAARCAHWYEWHDHKTVHDRDSMEAKTSDAIIAALASTAGTELLAELQRLRAEKEELELKLVAIGDWAVADWDDKTVGAVDAAVKEPLKYKDRLRHLFIEIPAQRDQALAVATRTRLILQNGYEANRVAFSPSKILDVFQAALMSLDALFATRPDGPQGEGGGK